MSVSLNNFFSEYIIDPFSKDLTQKQKVICLVSSLAFAIFSCGLMHVGAYVLRQRKIQQISLSAIFENRSRFEEIARKTDQLATNLLNLPRKAVSKQSLGFFRDNGVAESVDLLLENFYSKKLPHKEDVEIPLPPQGKIDIQLPEGHKNAQGLRVVRFKELNRAQKIAINNYYAHPHDRLKGNECSWFVDFKFFAEGQEVYLEGDSKAHHGNDHSVRASLFSAAFAYLYNKYHPEYAGKISKDLCALIQVAAAGHDCGRQTEGTDFYDEVSASLMVDFAQKHCGVKNKSLLELVRESIEDKDGGKDEEGLSKKGIIAKCVQNADCAEYARLILNSPVQTKAGFENSRKFLDIYREMEMLAKENGGKLKGDLSFEDFLKELDNLRLEMNQLIYWTHKKEKRQEFVSQGGSYYQQLTKEITSVRYPHLHSVLEKSVLGREGDHPLISNYKERAGQIFKEIDCRFSSMTIEELEACQKELEGLKGVTGRRKYIKEVKSRVHFLNLETSRFNKLKARFSSSLKQGKRDKILQKKFVELVKKYAELPQVLKEQEEVVPLYREAKKKGLTKNLLKQRLSKKGFASFFLHMKQEKLEAYLEDPEAKVEDVYLKAKKLAEIYQRWGQEHGSPQMLSTIALSYNRYAYALLEQAEGKEAKEKEARAVFDQVACLELHRKQFFCQSHVLEKGFADPLFVRGGCRMVRKHKLRLQNKKIDNKEFLEISLELDSQARKDWENLLPMLGRGDEVKLSQVDSSYEKVTGKNKFQTQGSLRLSGKDHRMYFPKSGIDIRLGADRSVWNQNHLVRARIPLGTKPQNLFSALSKVGLGTAILEPTVKEIQKEGLARALKFRFPTEVLSKKKGLQGKSWSPKEVYSSLKDAEKETINKDLQRMMVKSVDCGSHELVNPALGKEAQEYGIQSLCTFINAGGSIEDTSQVLIKILESGMLSSQERFQRGIFGLGCAPMYNYRTGSGNQVFTRALTSKHFDEEMDFREFAITGPIMLLFDTQALERMPYSYLHDRGGLRNPHYSQLLFTPEKQWPIFNYKGKDRILEQESLKTLADGLNRHKYPLNETMFDHTLSKKYINKIVVWNENDRLRLMEILEKSGIKGVNGIPLDQMIVATSKLDKKLLKKG